MIYKGVKGLLDVTISACSINNWTPPPIIIKQDTKEKLNTYPPLFSETLASPRVSLVLHTLLYTPNTMISIALVMYILYNILIITIEEGRIMEKSKRIAAIIGIIVLVGCYLTTLVAALMKSPNAWALFQASLFCSLVIPIVIYGYMILIKVTRHKDE